MTGINHYSALPLYQQLVQLILEKIDEGDWQVNDLIPTEREFSEKYNISRTTVRQAINLLAMQGYLNRKQGKGTYVAPPKLKPSLHTLQGFSETLRANGMKPGQKILFLDQVKPCKKVCQLLDINVEEDLVYLIKRLRFANQEPIGIQESYLHLPNHSLLTTENLEKEGSLYHLLENKFDLKPSKASETIEAVVADRNEAELLRVEQGAPLLLIERITWSQLNKPLEFLKTCFRGDRYKYMAHQRRDGSHLSEEFAVSVMTEN